MKLKNLSKEDLERRSRLITCYYSSDNKLSKTDLANSAGYSIEYIARLFSGERRISDEAAKNIAKALNVRKEYILCIDNYKTTEEFNSAINRINSITAAINSFSFDNNYLTSYTHIENNNNASSDDNCYKSRYLINTKEEKFVELSFDEYIALCNEISDYINFKLERTKTSGSTNIKQSTSYLKRLLLISMYLR